MVPIYCAIAAQNLREQLDQRALIVQLGQIYRWADVCSCVDPRESPLSVDCALSLIFLLSEVNLRDICLRVFVVRVLLSWAVDSRPDHCRAILLILRRLINLVLPAHPFVYLIMRWFVPPLNQILFSLLDAKGAHRSIALLGDINVSHWRRAIWISFLVLNSLLLRQLSQVAWRVRFIQTMV